MVGPSRGIPEGHWRAEDLNGMWQQECVCTACGLVLLSQRQIGLRHRRDAHRSLDIDWPLFVPYTPPPGTPRLVL